MQGNVSELDSHFGIIRHIRKLKEQHLAGQKKARKKAGWGFS